MRQLHMVVAHRIVGLGHAVPETSMNGRTLALAGASPGQPIASCDGQMAVGCAGI